MAHDAEGDDPSNHTNESKHNQGAHGTKSERQKGSRGQGTRHDGTTCSCQTPAHELNAIHGRALRRRYGFVDSERYASEEEGMQDFAGAH
jgi:hypothetical protein